MPDLQTLFIWIIPVLFAITLHEAAHGWIAGKFGDHTARMMGRVTSILSNILTPWVPS